MKKRLIFTIDTISKSGIVNVVNNIALEMYLEGRYDVSILCTGIIERNKIDSKITVFNLDIIKYGRRGKYLHLIPKLKSFFENNNFDCVIISGMEFVPFYYCVCRKGNMKLIAWEHLNFHAGPKYRLEWMGKRIACRFFDGIVCITKKDAEMYKQYCRGKEKVYQIYNVSNQIEKTNTYNVVSKKMITVAYLGEYYKGFDLLVDVASELFSSVDGWTWDIYGEGKDKEKIQKKIKTRGLQSNVFLKGYAENINELYSDYSMFILTSRIEGMGMVLIEAEKKGLPVISFDIECGPSDVISDGINGFLIKPFDTHEMAEKIRFLIRNEETRISFSKRSLVNLEEFDKRKILTKWNNMIDEI